MTKIRRSFLVAVVSAKPEFRAMNPNCADNDKLCKKRGSKQNPVQVKILAAQECENDCQDINLTCIVACGGDAGCISECTRDFTYCLDRCPCYQNCYNGCPCSYETEYCRDPCHAENEDHYKPGIHIPEPS